MIRTQPGIFDNRKVNYIAQGATIRSRARWYEEGEKSNKYFLNLESSRGKKCSIRKIFTRNETLTTNPKVILDELSSFYSNLYQKDSCSATLMDSLLGKISMPALSDSQKQKCEEKLTISECYSSLKSFQKNKTPGNDGLTAEFYLGFWSIFGKHLVITHTNMENYQTPKSKQLSPCWKKRVKTKDSLKIGDQYL